MGNSSNKHVNIIGGGVSGITTGILLQLSGFSTCIFTRERADRPINPDNPAFSSLYPSASVLPHSVFGEQVAGCLQDSLRIFDLLYEAGFPGVTVHKHYEVFEYEKDTPFYSGYLHNFRRIDEKWHQDADLPRLSTTETLFGWIFDCFFADWPVYMPKLFELYEELGGNIEILDVTKEIIRGFDDPIVNCSGIGSISLFDDQHANQVLKGHLIKVSGAPIIQSDTGQTISYNYNPVPEKYSDPEGNTQDVYCYPRNEGWIIGGSRIKGAIDSNGNWNGPGSDEPTIDISGKPVPSPVLELNREILSESYGITLSNYPEMKVESGFRYIRSEQKGLRLERTSEDGKLIIHNYGHGGAGVTLSWGCAIQIVRWIIEDHPEMYEPETSGLFSRAVWKHLEKIR